MNNKTKELMNDLEYIKKRFEKSIKQNRQDQRKFNIFKIIAKGRWHYEEMHSAFMAMLLDPQGNHGQGRKFFDLFLDYCKIPKKFYSQIEVRLEYLTKNRRRIDILIFDKKKHNAIIIENKINYASYQENQLEDYCKDIEKKGYTINKTILFTLHEDDDIPYIHEKKVKEFDHKYYYGDDNSLLKAWLEKCKKWVTNSEISSVIGQYNELIKDIGEEKMDDETLKEFLDKLDSQDIAIINNLKEMLDETKNYFYQKYIPEFLGYSETKIKEYIGDGLTYKKLSETLSIKYEFYNNWFCYGFYSSKTLNQNKKKELKMCFNEDRNVLEDDDKHVWISIEITFQDALKNNWKQDIKMKLEHLYDKYKELNK